ncbi:DUF2802 domain-containing protein [Colwellia sp. E2M01]|uniref:DUF2802 domain-containing protein n=1 Tax=Colwellia sp. E2M01 TaxID=2841561 RepID=UPI001C08F51E|nr:DUF2802 domain-containing protein [Colwellia sp. E2M01]MBU2869927.1 DUF2802 domain-containing protein [Colwellia sp. E2M01]
MSLLAIPIIAILALFLVLLMSTIFFIRLKQHKEKLALLDAQVQSTLLLINELQLVNDKAQQQVALIKANYEQETFENNQVSKQLELRIKNLTNQVVEQEQRLLQWQENQGQDKFYNRAFKLAAKGADVDEIINECELPRAEVEMLLSVYQQRKRS